MVLNRPPAGKPAPTLIVCMVALLGQWNQEIELKTDLGLKCLIYHGMFKLLPCAPALAQIHAPGNGKVRRAEDLRGYDIVLTTYHVSFHPHFCISVCNVRTDVLQTLISECPEDEEELEKKRKRNKKKNGDAWLVDDVVDKKGKRTRKTNGPLFDVTVRAFSCLAFSYTWLTMYAVVCRAAASFSLYSAILAGIESFLTKPRTSAIVVHVRSISSVTKKS